MFKFRLRSILRLREHHEKKCREEFGKCVQGLRLAELRENELLQKKQAIAAELAEGQKGVIEVAVLLLGEDYWRFTKIQLAGQKEVVRVKNEEMNEARLNLIEAMQEKKVLEKLQEKQYQDYLYENNRAEQELYNDMANKEVRNE